MPNNDDDDVVALITVRLSAAVNELVQKRLAEELSLCLSSKLQQ